MALILPNTPLVTTSPEVAKLHRLLKQLPDDVYTVWHRLTIYPEPGPDFWVMHREQRALWLKVSSLTSAGARRFGQADLFHAQAGRPADAEHKALVNFVRAHIAEISQANFQRVPAAVVFPNLSDS
ncbi:MAG: hypothetical protein ACT4QE_03905, partial [Anaerolineales bacterium]